MLIKQNWYMSLGLRSCGGEVPGILPLSPHVLPPPPSSLGMQNYLGTCYVFVILWIHIDRVMCMFIFVVPFCCFFFISPLILSILPIYPSCPFIHLAYLSINCPIGQFNVTCSSYINKISVFVMCVYICMEGVN